MPINTGSGVCCMGSVYNNLFSFLKFFKSFEIFVLNSCATKVSFKKVHV